MDSNSSSGSYSENSKGNNNTSGNRSIINSSSKQKH